MDILQYEKMPLHEIARAFGMIVKPAGDKWKALCRFHPDKGSPSLIFYPNDTFFCFGCKTSGSKEYFIARMLPLVKGDKLSPSQISSLWKSKGKTKNMCLAKPTDATSNEDYTLAAYRYLIAKIRADHGQMSTTTNGILKYVDDYMLEHPVLSKDDYDNIVNLVKDADMR